MHDILDEIVAHKRIEVARQKESLSVAEIHRLVEKELTDGGRDTLSMRRSLEHSASGIIAEFKRKSPSKGWIHEDARVEDVAPQYSQGGASAISILTDEHYFGGDMQFITRVRGDVTVPILRKDFIIDEYQLFQARLIGADAVLLIAADLTKQECKSLAHTAHELGLETLLETHSEHETDYITDDIDMVGVNNRNLGTFVVDVENSFRMIRHLPTDRTLVSESGISDVDTIRSLRAVGYRGYLIGENFMKTSDPGASLRQFVNMVEA